MPSIEIVVCLSKNFVIGINNKMPWHISADLKHFKEITTGHPVIMGRNTFLSIGKALPNRRNIVVTSQALDYDNIECITSLDKALDLVKDSSKIMIIGGGQIYRASIDKAHVLHLTIIDKDFDGDTKFPEFDKEQFTLQDKSETFIDEKSSLSFHFETWIRKD